MDRVILTDVVVRANSASNGKNLGVRSGEFEVLEIRERPTGTWYRIGEDEWVLSGSGVDFISDAEVVYDAEVAAETVEGAQINSASETEESEETEFTPDTDEEVEFGNNITEESITDGSVEDMKDDAAENQDTIMDEKDVEESETSDGDAEFDVAADKVEDNYTESGSKESVHSPYVPDVSIPQPVKPAPDPVESIEQPSSASDESGVDAGEAESISSTSRNPEVNPDPVIPAPDPPKVGEPEAIMYKVNDKVKFLGGKHYADSSGKGGANVASCFAVVTKVYPGLYPLKLHKVNVVGTKLNKGEMGFVSPNQVIPRK